MKFKKAIRYDILIRPTPNEGFIVEVGCVKVVYAGWASLIQDLSEYLAEPEKFEKQYNNDIQSLSKVQIGTYGPSVPSIMAQAITREADLKNYPGQAVVTDKEL